MQQAAPRVAAKQPSQVELSSVEDAATKSALSTLRAVVTSSLGPHGRLKAVHNDKGGHVTLTSSSSRLLTALSSSHPAIRLLLAAVNAHISTFTDGGLSVALMALALLQRSLSSTVPRRLLVEIYNLALRRCLNHLTRSPDCWCRWPIDVGNLSQLHSLVYSVVSTKQACCLTADNIHHLSTIIVRAFLATFRGSVDLPSPSVTAHVCHALVTGRPASESQVLDGVLFASPQIPTYRKRPLNVNRLPDGTIRTAVFTASLAGDTDAMQEASCEMEEEKLVEHGVLTMLEQLAVSLLQEQVGVVLCQKVVHPTIKQKLQAGGVLVVERLGSQHVIPILALTGATPIGSFLSPPLERGYGLLSEIRHVVLGGRSYLHLGRQAAPVVTLVLCNRSESALDEMKHVSGAAHDVLKRILLTPYALPGGGQWQIHVAEILKDEQVREGADWCTELGCSRTQLATAIDAFCGALCDVARATSSGQQGGCGREEEGAPRQHRDGVRRPDPACPTRESGKWAAETDGSGCHSSRRKWGEQDHSFLVAGPAGDPQSTNMTKVGDSPSPTIVDLLDISVNGLKTAVGAATVMLGTHNCVYDTN